MGLWDWSKTAIDNDDADSSINLREGQAPSTLNNASRAIMAMIAKWRDDISGVVATGGTAGALTIASNQSFTGLADGVSVRARITTANDPDATLEVDSTGALPIQISAGVAAPSGQLVAGSIADFVYSDDEQAWIIVAGTAVPSSRSIGNGTGITGGGDLSANRTMGVDKASAANVRAAASNKVITSDLIETASAPVDLVDASPVAIDWDAGINFNLTVSADRKIGNPTNGQPGTWRTIMVQGADSTDRAITFDTQFLGDTPNIADCDNGKWYQISIYCHTTSHFVASSRVAKGS